MKENKNNNLGNAPRANQNDNYEKTMPMKLMR